MTGRRLARGEIEAALERPERDQQTAGVDRLRRSYGDGFHDRRELGKHLRLRSLLGRDQREHRFHFGYRCETFERCGLLVQSGSRWALGPDQLITDFLLYVDLQEQYDPLNLHQLAELAGLNEQDAAQIARRVLQARLADARRASPKLVDAYSTYLALKQRFEYAED